MYCQTGSTCKPFVTDFALKWFLFSVGALMSFQIAECYKPSVTNFVHKWFVSSVGAFVDVFSNGWIV